MSTTRVTKYTVYPDGFDTFAHSDKYSDDGGDAA